MLFAIIFLWTPPHFWALALVKAGDYRPRRHSDAAQCRRPRPRPAGRSWLYSLVMAPVAVLPALMGFAGLAYLIVSVVTGLAMIALAVRVLRTTEGDAAYKAAYSLFGFSILYLFLLFAVLLAENSLGLMWALPKVLG